MMAETAVQQDLCKTCGVEIREESLFCYNCGKSVREEPEIREEPPPSTDIAAASNSKPLRTAAALRRQRRAYNRQPVQIAWEPREGSSVAFVVATVALTLGALILLLLALYLR